MSNIPHQTAVECSCGFTTGTKNAKIQAFGWIDNSNDAGTKFPGVLIEDPRYTLSSYVYHVKSPTGNILPSSWRRPAERDEISKGKVYKEGHNQTPARRFTEKERMLTLGDR